MESHHSAKGHARGIADLKLDSTGSRLFALSLDRSIYMYQLSHLRSQPLHRFQDPTYHNAYFCKLAVSPDDMFVAAASDNGSIYTWDVLRPHVPATRLQGHKAFVTGIAWSPYAEQQVNHAEFYKHRVETHTVYYRWPVVRTTVRFEYGSLGGNRLRKSLLLKMRCNKIIMDLHCVVRKEKENEKEGRNGSIFHNDISQQGTGVRQLG